MHNNQALIELKDIGKIFYSDELETHALAEVSLEINRGEFVSIAGPSGCGKSTLLSILGLLDNSSSGQFFLKGQDVSGIPAAQRAVIRNREMGFIFQSFNLISDLTVYENVALPLTYHGDKSRREIFELVHKALNKVNMGHRKSHFPAQLSGGQQQRVAVARAIVASPAIIFADEPTGNLDSSNAQSVMTLLKTLHDEGATICMVTHDQQSAASAQRIIELFDGKLVDDSKAISAVKSA